MPAPKSNEVRKIIVNLIKQKILTHVEIAEALEIDPSTVNNISKLYKKTDSIEPQPHRGGNPGWFLDSDYPLLQQLVNKNNDSTLEELARLFEEKTGELPAISTLNDALKRLNITRKKKRKQPPSETGRM